MDSCHCQGLEIETEKWALEDLALYRKGKPAKTTLMLVNALIREGVEALSLLDIGGGIGYYTSNFSTQGVAAATSVEASTAYIQVARQEGLRRLKWITGSPMCTETSFHLQPQSLRPILSHLIE